ncbi:hypothetical protein PLICRDRAFT_673490, partial [Plicaturopsis crispa FD-325 SS-3]
MGLGCGALTLCVTVDSSWSPYGLGRNVSLYISSYHACPPCDLNPLGFDPGLSQVSAFENKFESSPMLAFAVESGCLSTLNVFRIVSHLSLTVRTSVLMY